MYFVINSNYFIINNVVSVLVFIFTIFVCCFRVYFYCTFEIPFAAGIISAIKQAKIMVVINMWKFQLWDKGATARASSVTSGPTTPGLLKINSFIVDFIIGDNVPGYGKRLAAKFSLVFVSHRFDIIGRPKQVDLLCRGIAFVKNVYCFLRYFWRPFEAESGLYKA